MSFWNLFSFGPHALALSPVHYTVVMGASISAGKNNDELVDNLIDADYLKSASLQQIFRAVDRGDYYSKGDKENAYRDAAYRNGNLHLSAPCVYSEVMEALKLRTGMSFLNLGSGSGYLSTLAGLVLGPFGVNHGIELYHDVVDFAYNRLEDFVKQSEAVDAYEFCIPSFAVGNCLKIDSNSQLYDRVYCGAACPEEHEPYMKHLIKIGGILVMPLNNKLLQITRTGDTTWISTKVLSVSFAPLIPLLPSSLKEPVPFVKLPDISPPSLQEICRSKVRMILREHIDKEHPNLKTRRSRPRNRSRRQVRRLVIPIIDESESTNSNSQSNSDNDDDNNDSDKAAQFTMDPGMPSRASAFIENFMRGRADIQEVVAGPSNWRESFRSSATVITNTTRLASNAEAPVKQEVPVKKVESDDSDSDMNTDDDNKSQTSDSEMCCPSFINKAKEQLKEEETGKNTKDKAKNSSPKKQLRKRHHSGTDQRNVKSRKRVLTHPRLKLRRHTATVIWKRVPSGGAVSDPEPERIAEPKQPATTAGNEQNYTNLMCEKISLLPLPLPLRNYINYNRNTL